MSPTDPTPNHQGPTIDTEIGSSETDSLLEGLNPEQYRAVTGDSLPLAIQAGAGSGKTRVLTRRIAWRSSNGFNDPRRILALTFTRKAASELRSRLRSLGLRDQVAAGTFHSVAYAQLRTFWRSNEQREPELLDRKFTVITPLLPRDRRSTDVLDVVSEIEWARARRISPEAYPQQAELLKRNPPLPSTTISRIYREYGEVKTDRNLLDYDDLLERCAKTLRSNKTFADAQRWRFKHLYVDEFQDVNPLQFALLTAWLGDRDDLCVVGDSNQAIYGWNGADADYLNRFDTHFPGATVVELRRNYRNTPQILRTAFAVLPETEPMESNHQNGPSPILTTHADDESEALALTQRIRELQTDSRLWSRQAILVRTNAQVDLMVRSLHKAEIPCRIRTGSSILDRADIKTVLRDLSQKDRPLIDFLGDLALELKGNGLEVEASHETIANQSDRTNAFSYLQTLAEEYLTLDTNGTALGFMKWARAQTRAMDSDSRDAVEVVTFHGAKGLEWDVVHIAGLEQGLVPIAHAREPAAIAEERRLLYVALSRAKKRLYLSWAQERTFGDRTSNRQPSFWLEDIKVAIQNLEKPFELTEQARRAAEVRRQVTRSKLPEHPVIEELKTWRLNQAVAANTEPYKILQDSALLSLVELWPIELADIQKVIGIGPIKAERLGPELLKILARHKKPRIEKTIQRAPLESKKLPDSQTNPSEDLIQALRNWRLEKANGKPAYTIFSNATMSELAATRPLTIEKLLTISGIGPTKIEQFGAELLNFFQSRE